MPRLQNWPQPLEFLDLVSYDIERSMAEGECVGRVVENTDHVPADGQDQERGLCIGAYWQE